MKRGLTLAVALALGTLTIPAHALGLGDIKAHSALNQNFKADIDLLSVAAGELDGVHVKLASEREFKRAGAERPFFLTLLKFRTERLKNGKAVIHVSSDFPVREPFMDFLLEVNWPKGHLIREYTVLLDPPATTHRRAPRVKTAPAHAQTSRATAQRMPAPRIVGGGEYGPVANNETLWGIARKLRPRGASMAQMMMALKQANPQAFIHGDINRLRTGQVLRVPSNDEVFSLSRQEAQQAYRSAQDAWLARRAQRMQAQAGKAAGASEGRQPAPGAATGPAAKSSGKGELRIATARPEGKGAAGASEIHGDETIEELKQKLLLARENVESSHLETETLRTEIGDLQKRIADMQRLLSLKDEQLARLQAGVAAADTGQSAPLEDDLAAAADQILDAQNAAGKPAVAEGAAKPSQSTGGETASASAGTDLVAAEQGAAAEGPAQQSAPSETGEQPSTTTPGEETASAPATTTGSAETQVATTKPAEPAPTEQGQAAERPAPGFLDSLMGDKLPYVAGGAGIMVLLLALLLRRRRAEDEEGLPLTPDQPVDEGPAESDSVLTEDDLDLDGSARTEADVEAEDTSFLSEFTPSDVNALRDETGEVDPISEADVYIAYGRYQQAEDLLQQAMERDPDRLALKHKLLEVYYATRNKEAFNALAQGMVESGQDIADQEAWSRVQDMGRELDDGNALYSGAGAGAPADGDVDGETGVLAADAPLSDLASDLAGEPLDTIEGGKASPEEAIDEPSLDLEDIKELEDLDDLDDESLPLEGLESLDLDLPGDEQRPPEPSEGVVDESLQLPSMQIESESTASDSNLADDELQAQLSELSDMSTLDGDLSKLSEDLSDMSKEAETGLDAPLSLEEAFDKVDGEDITEMDIDSLAPEVEATDAEAVDTKLDLAQAFVDMGDAEGARDILEEVVKEGNEQQRKTAQKLLGEIEPA